MTSKWKRYTIPNERKWRNNSNSSVYLFISFKKGRRIENTDQCTNKPQIHPAQNSQIMPTKTSKNKERTIKNMSGNKKPFHFHPVTIVIQNSNNTNLSKKQISKNKTCNNNQEQTPPTSIKYQFLDEDDLSLFIKGKSPFAQNKQVLHSSKKYFFLRRAETMWKLLRLTIVTSLVSTSSLISLTNESPPLRC